MLSDERSHDVWKGVGVSGRIKLFWTRAVSYTGTTAEVLVWHTGVAIVFIALVAKLKRTLAGAPWIHVVTRTFKIKRLALII